jgi:SNF family Na+-dependent transporter
LNTYILSKGLSGGVEKAAKVGMPLLLLFGLFLAYKGITLKAGEFGALLDGTVGLNFLWTPNFDSIWNTKVWFHTMLCSLCPQQTRYCIERHVRRLDE